MKLIRKLIDWFRYERLHHYPELAAFERSEALKRLEAYEREEHQVCRAWLRIVWALLGLVLLGILVASYYFHDRGPVQVLMLLVLILQWLIFFLLHTRIHRRVRAKVAAELQDGRLWVCIECGYDLRASNERCPECGAPIRVAPPASSS